MISATSLNAQSALNKGPQIPLNLENGRMRVESQFLVPSLPVSARAVGNHHSSDPKRRERSIVNGTAHPSSPSDNHYSHHHHSHPHQHNLSHNYPSHNINGLRPSYSSPHGGGSGPGTNPSSSHNNSNSNNHRVSPHHSYSHLNNSPRKDAHSPMYTGEVPGLSPGTGGNYSSRSSMPVPCSSPAQASSASPKGSHSHSPSNGTPTGGNYSPKLPSGPAMLPPPPTNSAELNSLAARLYPGFLAPHPSIGAPTFPQSFYAAAAAATHSLPYPLFGPHYNPHSHSAAAASAYLDSFHSTLANRAIQSERQQQRSRSPSPPPRVQASSYHHAQSQLQQHHHHQQQQQQSHSNQHGSSPQSTSVTSFHNKLIDSSAVSSDRHSFNGHHNSTHAHHHPSNNGRYSPGALGISKGGPLGISGGIINLQSTRMANGSSPKKVAHAENLVIHKSVNMNGYNGPSKAWVEHPGLTSSESMNRRSYAEMESNKDLRHNNHKEMFKESQLKHRVANHSPEDLTPSHPPSKQSKTITFASDAYPPSNVNSNRSSNTHHASISYAHVNGNGHLHVSSASNSGILTDSNNAKKQTNNHQISHLNNQNLQQQNSFLPPSPKKRSANWNFAVPASPTTKHDLPPPPPPPPLHTVNPTVQNSLHEPSKYLNSNQSQNHKPSNLHHSLPAPNSTNITNINNNNMTYLSSGQPAQNSPYPSSPRQSGSGPSTPKSPSVHQVKFTFNNSNSKENMNGLRNGSKSTRNDSSSSSSSNECSAPWPIEQMPLLEAFRRGSLIKLASGDLKPVEEMQFEDFMHSVNSTSESQRIIQCTVLSIQGEGTSKCKVTLAIGSQAQNQQVVAISTPEQPFFVLGRGWSSLSPKTTEKLLQLPCSPLSVGDVCITVRKNANPKTQSNNSRNQNPTGKSQAMKGKGNGLTSGKSRNSTNTANNNTNNSSQAANASVKRSQQAIHVVSNTPSTSNRQGSQEGHIAVPNDMQQIEKLSVSNGETMPGHLSPGKPISKNCMGPPLSIGSTAITLSKPNTSDADRDTMDLLGPPSPKKRRWSAPEPEILVAGGKEESSIKRKNTTPPPPVHSDNQKLSGGDKNETDVKSNVDRKTPDAQSAKA